MEQLILVEYMELNRKPTLEEVKLLEFLIKKSSLAISQNWKENLLVRPMNDGGMGGLYLFPAGRIFEDRILGKQISDFQFVDLDGIEVIVSLNVDTDGNLFELDIWKTNFERLLELPDVQSL